MEVAVEYRKSKLAVKILFLLLHLALIVSIPTDADSGEGDMCDYFFAALKGVPHEKLTRSQGEHNSFTDGKKAVGCEIRFVTNNTLLSFEDVPNFCADKGSVMYHMGWRIVTSLMADGPGSSLCGIRKDSVLCLILRHQPAYLDEKTGKIVQSETLTITVQCRQ